MRRKRLLTWLFCVCAPVCASGQSRQIALTVDESRSQIHFTDDAITPLLSINNPGSETTAKVRAELLDPADTVHASGEIEARLHEGVNEISVRLNGWTQKSDEWNDSIWYRVRYRVTPSQAGVTGTESVLALTAKADGLFDLRVVTSKRTVPGMPLRVRVYTQSLSTLLPMSGVKVSCVCTTITRRSCRTKKFIARFTRRGSDFADTACCWQKLVCLREWWSIGLRSRRL